MMSGGKLFIPSHLYKMFNIWGLLFDERIVTLSDVAHFEKLLHDAYFRQIRDRVHGSSVIEVRTVSRSSVRAAEEGVNLADLHCVCAGSRKEAENQNERSHRGLLAQCVKIASPDFNRVAINKTGLALVSAGKAGSRGRHSLSR